MLVLGGGCATVPPATAPLGTERETQRAAVPSQPGTGDAAAAEHDGMEPLLLLAGAVLDWCDTQDGVFRLPVISAPSCETGEVFYLGTLIGMFGATPDEAWWWEQRTGLPLPDDLMIGVLWYVGPNPDPKALCSASQGVLCQCAAAHAALKNPARVPVVLIGRAASEC